MKKRITGLFAATLLALSMMAGPAMAVDLGAKCEFAVGKTPLNYDCSNR